MEIANLRGDLILPWIQCSFQCLFLDGSWQGPVALTDNGSRAFYWSLSPCETTTNGSFTDFPSPDFRLANAIRYAGLFTLPDSDNPDLLVGLEIPAVDGGIHGHPLPDRGKDWGIEQPPSPPNTSDIFSAG
jgi:hypothetical protein